MYSSQAPYRSLYGAVLGHVGQDLFTDVLRPWLALHSEEVGWLTTFGARLNGDRWPAADDEDLCRLYALSLVNDALLLRFQYSPTRPLEEWIGFGITIDQYIEFATSLGLELTREPTFNPFFHEIVIAEAAPDASQEIEVSAEVWPCLMLGDPLFSRAGCAVRGGANHLNPEIATMSVLHWAHRRECRATKDLSVGWGSNSQWRTRFRRDYRGTDAFHFNVDGRIDALDADRGPNPNPSRECLEPNERGELVTNRCFIRTAKDDADLWPFDDRHTASFQFR